MGLYQKRLGDIAKPLKSKQATGCLFLCLCAGSHCLLRKDFLMNVIFFYNKIRVENITLSIPGLRSYSSEGRHKNGFTYVTTIFFLFFFLLSLFLLLYKKYENYELVHQLSPYILSLKGPNMTKIEVRVMALGKHRRDMMVNKCTSCQSCSVSSMKFISLTILRMR